MPKFHSVFSCLQNCCAVTDTKVPFLAPCTKPSARVTYFTTFWLMLFRPQLSQISFEDMKMLSEMQA